MIDIKVWFLGQYEPVLFPNVHDYYETRRILEIVQEELHRTETTKISRDKIKYYTIIDRVL
jgi:hypothetical protein